MARNELDPDHITAVCDRLTETTTGGLTIASTRRSYAITAPNAADARRVDAALTQLGYRVSRPEILGRRDRVTVTGWSRGGLQARVGTLRDAVYRLATSRESTAAAALDHGHHSGGDLAALHDTLRAATERATGPITDYPAAARPVDPENAWLLRTAHELEHDVALCVDSHVDAAQRAVRLFDRYRRNLPDDPARGYAISQAADPGDPPSRWARRTAPADTAYSTTATGASAHAAGGAEYSAGSAHRPDAATTPLDPALLEDSANVEIIPDEHPATVADHDQPAMTPAAVDVEIIDDPPHTPSPQHQPGRTRGM